MKLYIYEHCPFCSRVQFVARHLNIELEEVPLDYDDEQTPIRLVGQKIVPILIKDDGIAMAESSDIIEYLMDQVGYTGPKKVQSETLEWQTKLFPSLMRIGFPRWHYSDLPEFKTSESKREWVAKKQTADLNFSELLNHTESYVSQTEDLLKELNEYFQFNSDKLKLNLIDLAVFFSILRGYCCADSIQWPVTIKNWLDNESCFTRIPQIK